MAPAFGSRPDMVRHALNSPKITISYACRGTNASGLGLWGNRAGSRPCPRI